ncbi:MAG TPA: isoprenylcysteine carboxylmethyltransferase family protein [Chthoniobacterales bacterium]|jgi:protein-S-isoprenylcysteine O-methyltransferase Ste14
MKTLSLLGYIIIVAGILALWRTGSLFALHPLLIAAQVSAVGLMVWARATFGIRSFHPGADPTAGNLVTNGPYRFIRHPIYASICLFTLAGLTGHFTPIGLLLFGVVVAGAMIRIVCEERLLAQKYPEYTQYSKQTPRLIPGLY